MSTTHLTITAEEEPRLLQVMKDIQENVAAYYVETARGGDLGRHVRTWLTRVQNLNDLLTEQLGDHATYKAVFASTASADAELINAVKYARNVLSSAADRGSGTCGGVKVQVSGFRGGDTTRIA